MLNPSRLIRFKPDADHRPSDQPNTFRTQSAIDERDDSPLSRHSQRRIGAIMIDLGLIDIEQAGRILEVQRDRGGRFGDIAVSMGYANAAQLALALARQRGVPGLLPGDLSRLSEALRAVMDTPRVLQAYSDARTQLELRWFDDTPERRLLAVISDAPSEGRTLTTAAIGLLLAMTGRRVLLIDACVEAPNLASHFGHTKAEWSLVDALNRPGELADAPASLEFLDLTVLSAAPGDLPPDIIPSRAFAGVMTAAASHWDAVLVDTPAWSVSRNALAVAVRCSGALSIARVGRSRLSNLEGMRRDLADAGVERVGAMAHLF